MSRGLSTAVALYAASMVLSGIAWKLSLVWTMMVLASITILYTTIGGIEADDLFRYCPRPVPCWPAAR